MVLVTPQTNAGAHTTTLVLLKGMWLDSTTGKKMVNRTTGRASLAAVPKQNGVPKYDGNPRTPSWDSSYGSNKMTVSMEPQINVETGYTTTFTPDSNHQRWDSEAGGKTVT